MNERHPGKTLKASAIVEVPFHDVDAMNVCWHGHYLKYFEIGRAALLRAFDYDYREMQASGYLWPIVEAHLKYVRPATYGWPAAAVATPALTICVPALDPSLLQRSHVAPSSLAKNRTFVPLVEK